MRCVHVVVVGNVAAAPVAVVVVAAVVYTAPVDDVTVDSVDDVVVAAAAVEVWEPPRVLERSWKRRTAAVAAVPVSSWRED